MAPHAPMDPFLRLPRLFVGLSCTHISTAAGILLLRLVSKWPSNNRGSPPSAVTCAPFDVTVARRTTDRSYRTEDFR